MLYFSRNCVFLLPLILEAFHSMFRFSFVDPQIPGHIPSVLKANLGVPKNDRSNLGVSKNRGTPGPKWMV